MVVKANGFSGIVLRTVKEQNICQELYEVHQAISLKFGLFFVVNIGIPCITNVFRLENPQILKLMVVEFKLKFEEKIKKIL